jgi:hypothetical protein
MNVVAFTFFFFPRLAQQRQPTINRSMVILAPSSIALSPPSTPQDGVYEWMQHAHVSL